MRGDRERLIAALQAIFNVGNTPLRTMVCLALSDFAKMNAKVISQTNIQENGEAH